MVRYKILDILENFASNSENGVTYITESATFYIRHPLARNYTAYAICVIPEAKHDPLKIPQYIRDAIIEKLGGNRYDRPKSWRLCTNRRDWKR